MPTETSRTGSTLFRSGCLVACCLLVVAGALTGAVSAHTELAGTAPDDGEQLDEPPAEVVLEFSGERIQVAEVEVTGPDGEDLSGEASIEGDSDVVTAPIEANGDGVYTVRWEILAEDGHSTNGAFFFVVGDEALDRDQVLAVHDDDDDETGGGPPFGESAIKGLLLASLLVLLGAPVTIAAIAPVVNRFDARSPTGARRARAIVAVAATTLFVTVAALGLVRVASLTGSPLRSLRTFVRTSVGRTWLLQGLVAGITLAGVLGGQRRDEHGLALGAGLLGGFAVAFTVGWTSHSATLVDRFMGVSVGVAHLAGAAIWVGGLAVLGVVVPPYLREMEGEGIRKLTASIARRFSLLAIVGVVVVSSTGLVLLSWHVPDATRLLATAYGRLLTVKLALVAVALGLGGINRFLLLRALRGDPGRSVLPGLDSVAWTRADGGRRRADPSVVKFVRAVRVEAAILLAVVLLSGALTSAPTAAAVAVGGDEAVQRTQVGDIEVAFEPVPATSTPAGTAIDAGQPVVYDVRFTVGGEPPDTIEEVALTLQDESGDGSMELDPEPVDQRTYSVLHTVPSEGTWTLQIDAFVDDVYVSERFSLEVAAGSPTPDGSTDDATDEYGDEAGLLAILARVGALGVGLVGTLAVAMEARTVRSADDRSRRNS